MPDGGGSGELRNKDLRHCNHRPLSYGVLNIFLKFAPVNASLQYQTAFDWSTSLIRFVIAGSPKLARKARFQRRPVSNSLLFPFTSKKAHTT